MVGLIDALKAQFSLPTKRIVIGGFSQGAMLTTDVALHLPEPPAALLVLSGTYVAEPVWKPLVANRKGLKVLQQHGTNDQVPSSIWTITNASCTGIMHATCVDLFAHHLDSGFSPYIRVLR